MATIKLEALGMAQLVAIVNTLQPEKPVTAKAFSQRSKAVERINKLLEAKGLHLKDFELDVDGNFVEKPKAPPAPPADAAPTKAKGAKKAKEPKPPKGPSIRSVAEEMLLEVASYDEDKRPVGHPYEMILNAIRAKYEGAKTSVACLRWYAVHMRERGVIVPSRPRPAAVLTVIKNDADGESTNDGKAETQSEG